MQNEQLQKYQECRKQVAGITNDFPQDDYELQQLCEEITHRKPKTIVEIGTRCGSSLWMLSQFAPEDAMIISIDLVGGRWGDNSSGESRLRIANSLRSSGKNIHLIDGDSQDEKTVQELSKILNGVEIDFLFIDADHSFGGVLRDWENYHNLVADRGMVAFHDIFEASRAKEVKVFLLWRVLKSIYAWKEFAANPGDIWGIGVIEFRKTPKGELK